MARHNFLIQLHMRGPDGANANVTGAGAEWRDCGTGYDHPDPDAFGNIGYSDLALARASIEKQRTSYPENAYRLIQIIS